MTSQKVAETKAKAVERGCKMYIVVNADLKMGKGKTCAQCGHAVAEWTRRLEHIPTPEYKAWLEEGEPKIVVKAEEETLLKFCAAYPDLTYGVHDAGRTQIPKGSLTTVAFQPLSPASAAAVELGKLKLL